MFKYRYVNFNFSKLREDFDHGKTLEETLSNNEEHVHDVATLLKEYFRALPDSLLCNDLYQCFIQTQSMTFFL